MKVGDYLQGQSGWLDSSDKRKQPERPNLHLIDELVLEETTEHHADEQPLRHRYARCAPEVWRVEMHGDGLARHLRDSRMG